MLSIALRASSRAFRPSLARSCAYSGSSALAADLPYHIVMGMPALSPTMEQGVLAEWYVGEGDSFIAGDALAKIETDKASIDFEAQDDGIVAKILQPAGTDDTLVNTPIMIAVEEPEDVEPFKNYVHEVEAPAAPQSTATEEPAAAAAPPPAEAPAPPPPAPAAAPATPEPAAPPVQAAVAAPPSSTFSTAWAPPKPTSGPLAAALGKAQAEYVERYGTTGQSLKSS